MSVATGAGAWLARLRPASAAEVRLICVPHAGGGAATFRTWADELPPGIDLLALRLPGRESRRRERPVRRMDELTRALARALDDRLDLPFGLFGYCSGALTAFELARHLARTGRPAPDRLFACAFPAPRLAARGTGVHLMPTAELARYVRELGLIPERIASDPALFGLFEAGLRADFEVLETAPYEPAPLLAIPITAIGARDDRTLTLEQLVAWHEQTTGDFTLRLHRGDHAFLDANRRVVLGAVTADLLGRSGGPVRG